MLGNLSGPTLIVIIFIVLLLFGAPKLPALARSLGQSMKILKKEVTNDEKSDADAQAETLDAPAALTPEQELAQAKAEAASAKAEAEALRAKSEKHDSAS